MNSDPQELLADLVRHTPRTRHSQRFSHDRASVTVRCTAPELLDDVRTALYCYRPTRPASSNWTVAVHTSLNADPAALARICWAQATLNIGPGLDARCRRIPSGRLFWVESRTTLIVLDQDTTTLDVYCPDLTMARSFAARLVRQVITAQLLDGGAVYAHAAAFQHHGTGVLIAGHKNAGKTTTLLTALHELGGALVSNDRVLLRTENTDVTGLGWPSHIPVGTGTLAGLPALRHLTVSHPHSSADTADNGDPPSKVTISIDELTRCLPKVTVIPRLQPRLMLWPHRTAHDAPPERVDPHRVGEILRRTQLFMHDPVRGASAHLNHWLLPSPGPHAQRASRSRIAAALAATVPCLRLAVSDDRHALTQHLAEVLANPPRPGAPRPADDAAGSKP